LDDGQTLLGGLRGTLLLHTSGEQFRTLSAPSTQGIVQLLPLESRGLALVDQSGRIFTAALADLQFKSFSVTPARTWLAVVQASDGALVGASFDGVSRLQPALTQPKT
jgi:hypothetical protein